MIAAPPCGYHCLADLSGVAPALLSDAPRLEELLVRAARAAGAHVLLARLHSFGDGLGVTGVVLLAESHISIHTWPETGFAAADIFMCGQADLGKALAVLLQGLRPASHSLRTLERGGGGSVREQGGSPMRACSSPIPAAPDDRLAPPRVS